MHTEFKIVGFGDSITLAMRQDEINKWLNIVGQGLGEAFSGISFTMINSGVGGNTSREGLARIEPDVIAHEPDLVLVEFGGNDITYIPERHVEPEEFSENLGKILKKIRASTHAEVMALTFPPIINERHQYGGMEFFTSRGGMEAYCEIYRDLTCEFAASNSLPLIDTHAALVEASLKKGNENITLPDGIHLTTAGNRVVAGAVLECVKNHIVAKFTAPNVK